MNLFYKRPLAVVLCIAILALFAYSSGEVWHRVVALAVIPLLFALSFIVKSKRAMLLVCTVALAVSSLCSALYFDFWFYPNLRFEEEVHIVAEVETVNRDKYYNSVYIKTDSINGTPFSSHRLVMYLNDEEAYPLSSGCTIEFCATLSATDFASSDISNYYSSMGVGAIAEPVGDLTVTEEGTIPLSQLFASFREHLRRRAISLSDESTGNLIAALLFGERVMLPTDVSRDFMRVGITHMLALSGMHLAILTLGLGKALSFIGISKKPRSILLILFTLFYMALTGFPISVIRAGIMLIITYLLFLFGLSHDSVTSLFIAVFIICLIIPYSVFDISLWLSAFATLGIILFGEYSLGKKCKNILLRVIHWIATAFNSSVFAICATFAICVFCFDGISLLSPVSTMILSPLIEVIMYSGSLMLLFGDFIPLGGITGFLSDIALKLINLGSSLDYAYVTVDNTALKISVIAVTILFYAFAVFNVKHKRIAVFIICVAFSSVFALACSVHRSIMLENELLYMANEDDNCFLIKKSHEVTVIESAGYYEPRGYILSDLIYSCGVTVVDDLRLTGYGFGISAELDALSRYVLIRQLSLPKPQNEDEETILSILEAQTSKLGCKISLYAPGDVTFVGDTEIRHLCSLPYGEKGDGTAFELKTCGEKYVYMSSGFDYEGSDIMLKEYLETLDGIIFAQDGTAYKKKTYFDYELPRLRLLVLGAENLFLTQERLAYYEQEGCKVYSHPERLSLTK